jgi:hypothetical protein
MAVRADLFTPPSDGIDLYWLPMGAGDNTHCVRSNGRVFERFVAAKQHRDPVDLYHSALEVRTGHGRYVVEMAPVWGTDAPDRGVVAEGPVGLGWLGRSRLFRYEVRCWRDGAIPDRACAVGGPRRVRTDGARCEKLLSLTTASPTATWGRDELRTGDMWNSNSLVSWLLARSGHDLSGVGPPVHGRAPGWDAGLVVAARSMRREWTGRSEGRGPAGARHRKEVPAP